MKKINTITKAHLRSVKAIEDHCRKTHVMMPPVAYCNIDVFNPNGEQELEMKFPSKSWVRNAYNISSMSLTGAPTNSGTGAYGAGGMALRTRLGTLTAGAGIEYPNGASCMLGGLGEHRTGITVGISDTAESFDAYSLAGPTSDSTTVKLTRLASPAGALVQGLGMSITANGTYLARGLTMAPYFELYKRDVTNFVKVANPLDTAVARSISFPAFSPDGTYLVLASSAAPYVEVYKKTAGMDYWTKIATPFDIAPTVASYSAQFSPDGAHLSFTGSSSPYIHNYKVNGDDTFTKLANPDVLLTTYCSQAQAIAYSADSQYLAVSNLGNTTKLYIYKISGDIYTKTTAPDVTPSGSVLAVAWSQDGTKIAVSTTASPFMYIYAFNNTTDTLTRITTIDTLPASAGHGLAFSPDGKNLVCTTGTTGSCAISYSILGNTFTKQSLLDVMIPDVSEYVLFMPNGYEVLFNTQTISETSLCRACIAPGITHTAQLGAVSTYNADTKKWTVTLSRAFSNNNATESITIKEIGLFMNGAGQTTEFYMINREVLATPVTLAPGGSMTVTFTIETTYPQ